MLQVIFKQETHRGHLVLSMYMPKDQRLNSAVKTLGAKWSSSKKMWWLAYDRKTVNTAFKALQPITFVDYSALKAKQEAPTPSKQEENTTRLEAIKWTAE